jgi:Right handed beta helix region
VPPSDVHRSELPAGSARRIGGALLLLLLAVLAGLARLAAQIEPGPESGDPPSPTRLLRRATVDCTAGQSLASALLLPADDLEISIRGICRESVEIRRDSVVLSGGDPQRDGVRAPQGWSGGVVVVRGASHVRLEGLSISGSNGDGLRVVASPEAIELDNCRLEDNAGWGAAVLDSGVSFSNTVFTGNGTVEGAGGGGLLVQRGSEVACDGCVIGDNPLAGRKPGAAVLSGSSLTLRDSTLEGSTALLARLHATLTVTDTQLAGADWSLEAAYETEAFVRGGELVGSFLVADRSTLQLLGAAQSYNGDQNFVAEGSSLLVDDRAGDGEERQASEIEGLTVVSDFSTAKLVHGSRVGELACALDSRAFCDGTETKAVARGCADCP